MTGWPWWVGCALRAAAILSPALLSPSMAAAEAGSPQSVPHNPESNTSMLDYQARRATFEAGMAALKQERWSEARTVFESLWEGQKTYDVALQLGLAEYNLKQWRSAAEYLLFGLENLPPRENRDTAVRAQQFLELCKRELGTLKLETTPEGAELLVDSKPTNAGASATEVFVDPGPHDFTLKMAGFRPEHWSMSFKQGEEQTLAVTLLPEGRGGPRSTALAAASAGADEGTLNPSEPPNHADWLPVIVGGATTLVGAGAGVVFEVMRRSKASEADDILARLGAGACADPNGENDADCNRLNQANSAYDELGMLEAASFGLAGLSLAATATYFLITRPDQNQNQTARSTNPSAVRFGATVSRQSSHFVFGTSF